MIRLLIKIIILLTVGALALVGALTIGIITADPPYIMPPKTLSYDKSQNKPYIVYCTKTVVQSKAIRNCSIRLSSTIGKPEQYRNLLQLLTVATKHDTITFHLIGRGGQVNSLIQLANTIKTSKANTISIVEGDVYSAHADLAIATNKLIIRPHVMFLFHRSSAYGQIDKYCSRAKGRLDRTVDAERKCRDYLNAHLKLDLAFANDYIKPLLTRKEYLQFTVGHDILITGKEMKKRIAKVRK